MNRWLVRAVCLAGLLGGGTTNPLNVYAVDQPAAAITLSPTSVEFGTQPAGQAGAARPVTVSNSRPHPVALQVLTSGIDFSQTNDCGESLAANASCTVQIVFKPAITGPRIGTLTVDSGKSAIQHIVVLSGTGE